MKALPLLLLAACSGSEILATPAEGTIELRPGTLVDPESATPGSIVISTAGDGYVRRVAADGSMAPASLFDAFASAKVRQTFTAEPVDLDAHVTAKLDVDVGARVQLAPEIDLAFELDAKGLVSLDVNVRGAFGARLDSHLVLDGAGGWNGVRTFESEPLRLISHVDGVPIIIVARVVTDVAAYAAGPDGARLRADATSNVELDTQAHFDRWEGWTLIEGSEREAFVRTHGAHRGAGGRMHVAAVVTQRLQLQLFDQPLAYVELRATSSAAAAECIALGEGSVGAALGINGSALYPGVLLRYTPLFRQVHPSLSEMPCE